MHLHMPTRLAILCLVLLGSTLAKAAPTGQSIHSNTIARNYNYKLDYNVSAWLSSLFLDNYASLFKTERFDSLDDVQSITEEDLLAMGVPRGHIRRILSHLPDPTTRKGGVNTNTNTNTNTTSTVITANQGRDGAADVASSSAAVAVAPPPPPPPPPRQWQPTPPSTFQPGRGDSGGTTAVSAAACALIARSTIYSAACSKAGGGGGGHGVLPELYPLLVTATPRSGTVYTYQLLRKLGLDVSSDWDGPRADGMVSWIHAFAGKEGSRINDHPNFVGHSYYGQVPLDRAKYLQKGKNNYGNAHFDSNRAKFKVMVHLVRDVLKSITSMSCSEPFLAPDYQSYIRRHVPFEPGRGVEDAKDCHGGITPQQVVRGSKISSICGNKVVLGMQMYVGWHTFLQQLANATGSYRCVQCDSTLPACLPAAACLPACLRRSGNHVGM